MALATLVAGVNYNAQAIYLRPFDNGALADWSMNGGANRNNEFLLDGVPNNANINGNNIAYVPPAEAVQEFKVATNSYDAQYGRTAGGVINMSLKSGTNSLHGVGYEFYRRKWLDANSFLLNAANKPKVDHYLDQYGFSVDGPVAIPGLYNGRNKTFFLFTGEKYREGTPAPQFSTVPTEAMRRGDFSDYRDINGNLITIYDPATGRNVNGTWVARSIPQQPDPAGPVRPGRAEDPPELSAAELPGSRGRRLAEQPGLYRALQQGQVLELGRQGRSQLQQQRSRVRAVGQERAQRDPQHHRDPQRAGAERPAAVDPHQQCHRRRLGAGVRRRLRLQLARRLQRVPRIEPLRRGARLRRHLTGLPLVARVTASGQALSRHHDGRLRPALARAGNENTSKIWSLQPNVSLTRGRHNIRSGLDMRTTNVEARTIGSAAMQIGFNRTFTQRDFSRGDALSGSSFASFLLGAPATGFIDNNVLPDYGWNFVAPWIQDDWRVNNRLTVNGASAGTSTVRSARRRTG